MTKYDQSYTVSFPAAQEQMHVVCRASSVSYVTCCGAVHMLSFDPYCIIHAAANLMEKSIPGFEQPVTLELHKQVLASKCCIACSALLCCTCGLLVSKRSKLPFLVQEMTPLHYACGNGQLQVVQFLLRHGADPSLEDEDVSNRLLLTAYVLSPSADTNLHCKLTTSCHIAAVHHIVMLLAKGIHMLTTRMLQ